MSAKPSTLGVRVSRLTMAALVACAIVVMALAAAAGPDVAAAWLAALYEGIGAAAESIATQATR